MRPSTDPEFQSVLVQWWLRISRSGAAVYDLESGTLDPVGDWLTTGPQRQIYAYPAEIWHFDTLVELAQEFEGRSGRSCVIASALQITVIINPDILHDIEIPQLYLAYIASL